MSASNEPKKIRKDLETIKSLLDEENTIPPVPIVDDEDIPTLDDSIEAERNAALSESTFKTLMSDAWRESVQELFAEGARRIDLPQDIDALSDALKLRIDKSVREWLQETLSANVDQLRQRMVHELSEELLQQLRSMTSNTGPDSNQKDDQS